VHVGSGQYPADYSCSGISIPSRGLSFFATGSNPHLQSRGVVEAQWYHSWSAIAEPKESDELMHCYGKHSVCIFTKIRLLVYEFISEKLHNNKALIVMTVLVSHIQLCR
jgi:hypothetical protein